MPKLALIKHSLPDLRPDAPASSWPLSEEGRRRCDALADSLRPLRLARVYASAEPKAAETALLLARGLGLPSQTRDGLHEHLRDAAGFLRPEDFEARLRELFARPHERVFGEESAAEALARFSRAVDRLLTEAPRQDLAVVAHGTVISLYVAEKCGIDAFALWRTLGLPSYVLVETPAYRLLDTVAEVAG